MKDAAGNAYPQEAQDLAASGLKVFNAKVGISEKAATTIGGNVAATTLTFGNGLPEITTNNYTTEYEKAINETVEAIAARNPLRQSGGETVALSAEQQSFTPAPQAEQTPSSNMRQTLTTPSPQPLQQAVEHLAAGQSLTQAKAMTPSSSQ